MVDIKDNVSNESVSPLVSLKPSGKSSKPKLKLTVFFSLGALVILAASIFYLYFSSQVPDTSKPTGGGGAGLIDKEDLKVEKFASEEEFKKYLAEGKKSTESSFGGMGGFGLQRSEIAFDAMMEAPMGLSLPDAGGGAEDRRVSETNVQVAGIDEPDIVKTDGETIYFSSENIYRAMEDVVRIAPGEVREMIAPPPRTSAETKVIAAFPPDALSEIADIREQGNLLLANETLMVFQNNEVIGYDVSDPANPEEIWDLDFDSRTYYQSARLYQNEIYLVTRKSLNDPIRCPMPMFEGADSVSIRCTDIYHPVKPFNSDVLYTFSKVNPKTGKVKDKTSFVGSSGQSVIYMSERSLYLTYAHRKNMNEFFLDFYSTDLSDLLPAEVSNKVAKIVSYDISAQSKMTELEIILEEYDASLSSGERKDLEKETEKRLEAYLAKNSRNFETTQIVKVDLSNFKVKANGAVSGSPLNQFSLDEYQGNLRIATTTSGRFGRGRTESFNDVYVLDSKLKVIGSVLDLGITERIYSARFIEDKGYVVTFRRIDPFYVLDLSDPKNPKLAGELKIPGYSSYLHPISENIILGVGEESNKVKLSLFDVSNPFNPLEVSKDLMGEYWTEVNSNHHAFLLDPEHQVFFLPAGNAGYIFSYKNNVLNLRKEVKDIRARRAIYIEDFMYIIGDDKLIVLSENNWQEVGRLEF